MQESEGKKMTSQPEEQVIPYNNDTATLIRDKIAKISGIEKDVASLLIERQRTLTLKLLNEQKKLLIDSTITGLMECEIEPTAELVWNVLLNVSHNQLLNTIRITPENSVINLSEWKRNIIQDIEREFDPKSSKK